MKKKIISAAVTAAMLTSSFAGFGIMSVNGAEWSPNTSGIPQYVPTARQMEEINRGLIAVYRTVDNRTVMTGEQGVYLSWRLLGTESLTDQKFDIYRDGVKIYTTGAHDATNYIDKTGTTTSKYKVVKAGATAAELAAEPEVTPGTNHTAKGSEVGSGNSEKNSFTYVDIPIQRPDPISRMGDGKTSYYYNTDSDHQGGANDGSVGDLDGDGDYELVLKWDPTDSKDSAGADFTGNVYIDAYEIDPNNTGYKWRIDLGQNVTAGAHYTQFMVYDLDGDGKSEVAMKTAPGSKDGLGNYVSVVGDTDAIRNVDNTKQFIGTSGRLKGKNPFTQYLTIFDGETGKALYTTEYIPYEAAADKYWGDGSAKYNRSERYLAAVAYLDGVHPSLIMCRGYYHDAVVRAYNWDGNELSMLWEHNAGKKAADTLYGQGNHNLSVADVDNDGKDEIVYGSAVLDDTGKAMGNTYLGHGDAMHVNDFNNDGVQEVFSVKEDSEGYKNNAANFRVASTGNTLWGKGASGDTGRGVMDNIDDEYAAANPDGLALAWSSSHANIFDLKGNEVAAKPTAGSRDMTNFLVYWDGDLGREILDDNIIGKYHVSTGGMRRFYASDGYSLAGGSSNNYTKRNPVLVADIWGDWREEVIMRCGVAETDTPYVRIFTSTLPTDYRLTTLMHDSQYRTSVAWQNVAYNQPTHTSYYVGSAALAKDTSGNKLNYLAPATPFTSVVYQLNNVPVTGVTIDEAVRVEKGNAVAIQSKVEPADASKKGIIWTVADSSIATVSNGVVTGIKEGKTTVTATTKDGGFTDTCEVEVYQTHVTGIKLSETTLSVGTGSVKPIKTIIEPADATDKSVQWKSSNTAVATVDADGNVTGVAEGTATITATTNDRKMKAECTVNVVPLVTTDITGDNQFVTNASSEQGSITLTANSASLQQKDAPVGGEFHKDFASYSDNKVTLRFKFTTGGTKIDGSNWNWTGHEYTFGLKFLDNEGDNILHLSQGYQDKAQSLMSTITNGQEKSFASDWTTVVDGIGNVQGSAKRWIVTIEFDYDNDVASAVIQGTDSSWAETACYSKTFDLNGSSFKTLQFYTTKDGDGGITANPKLEELTYTRTTTKDGATGTPLPTGEPTATPKPTATPEPTATPTPSPVPNVNEVSAFVNYESSRMTISDAAGEEKEVTFTNASNANNAFAGAYADISEYIKGAASYDVEFDSYVTNGSRAKIALVDASQRPAGSNKNSYVTTGVAFVEGVLDSNSYAAMADKNKGNAPTARDNYVHTKITVNTEDKTLSYKVTSADGAVLLSGTDTAASINAIEFFDIINSSVATMKNIKVITYTAPELSTPNPTNAPTTEPTLNPTDAPTPEPPKDYGIGDVTVTDGTITTAIKLDKDTASAVMLAATYDSEGRLTGITSVDVADIKTDEEKSVTLTFAEPLAEGTPVKLCLFDALKTQKPLCEAKGITVPAHSAQLSDLFDTDAMVDIFDAIDEIEMISE